MENTPHDHLAEMDLQLDNEVRQQLYESGKWTKFISIVVFTGCGLMLVFGIIGGTAIINAFRRLGTVNDLFGSFSGSVLLAVIIFVVAVITVVYYFLFNFSRKIKTALLSESTAELNAGLKSLKIFFIITTVFSMLSLINTIANMFR